MQSWRSVFADLEIYAVECALREVWDLLIADAGWRENALHVFNENQFSQAIVLRINDLIEDADAWTKYPTLQKLSETFDPFPVYDAKSSSRQKSKDGQPVFDTIPDFYFRRPTQPGMSPMSSGLFIEAKVIDSGKTMGNYCGKGLMRFVDSKYAWDMPQGLMLGYVRHTKQTLPDALAEHLSRHGKPQEYHLESGPQPFAKSRFSTRMHHTLHRRPNRHPKTGKPSGNILVYHLWLKA